MQQFLRCILLICSLLVAWGEARAARRPGIMRPLPLAMPAEMPQDPAASAMRGAWRVDAQSKQVSIVFTREANGTRNLWQATPSDESDWITKPLTRLTAPLWADEAQVSSDGRTIICLTNAVSDGNTGQLARLDAKTGRFEALTRDNAVLRSPTLSPDGKTVVYAREVATTSTIFLLSLSDKTAPLIPRRVVDGKRPAWLDNRTLLFCDSAKNGLYRLEIPADWPPLQTLKTKPQGIAWRGGAATATPDGSQLCLALDEDRNGNQSRLFFMAANGSGERALRNTDGARAPRFAPDGTALLFDAPLSPNGPRSLWVMNLAPVVPTVDIAYVKADKWGLNVVGTVFCEDAPEVAVKLEVGQGATPAQWQTLAQPKAPLQKESLAHWQLPDGAAGDWTVRLTASSPDGDTAQTSMTLNLPLSAGAAITNASPDVSIFVSPVSGAAGIFGTHGIGAEVIPGEWQNGNFIPRGPKTFPDKNHTTIAKPGLNQDNTNLITPPNATLPPSLAPAPATTPNQKASATNENGGVFETLPLPALPPPPVRGTLNSPPQTIASPESREPNFPSPVAKFTNEASNPAPKALNLTAPPVRRSDSLPTRLLGGPKEKTPTFSAVKPSAKAATQADSKAIPQITHSKLKPPQSAKRAISSVVSSRALTMEVPDSLVSGQDTNITLLVRNTGKTTWSSSDDNPARLLVRWFDSNSGQRFRWEIKWLPGSIAPGQTLPMPLVLTPPRAGKLRLNLVITRLPGGKYQPASNQSDDNLIKLAEKDLRVTVK